MKKTLESRLNSQIQTQKTLEKYQERFANNSVLTKAYNQLTSRLNDTRLLGTKVEAMPSKTAGNKNLAKEELISVLVKVGNVMKVYALHQKNENLLNLLITSENELSNKMKGGELLKYSYFIQETVAGDAPNLSPYGVNEELINDLNNEINDYAVVENEPRHIINERKTAKEMLEDAISEMSALIREQIDPLMELFIDDKEFYLEYKSARIIVDPSFRHRNEPLAN